MIALISLSQRTSDPAVMRPLWVNPMNISVIAVGAGNIGSTLYLNGTATSFEVADDIDGIRTKIERAISDLMQGVMHTGLEAARTMERDFDTGFGSSGDPRMP